MKDGSLPLICPLWSDTKNRCTHTAFYHSIDCSGDPTVCKMITAEFDSPVHRPNRDMMKEVIAARRVRDVKALLMKELEKGAKETEEDGDSTTVTVIVDVDQPCAICGHPEIDHYKHHKSTKTDMIYVCRLCECKRETKAEIRAYGVRQ
jgi:hypothetical protein